MTRRRLRLINPRSALTTVTMPEIVQKMTFSRRAVFMPLNLAICANVVPENWEVEIVDENVTGPHQATRGVDAIGIGAMTTQAPRAYAIADEYRALGVPVILGGIHVSVLPEEALQHADIVCKGDAEGTLPGALRDLDNALDAQRTSAATAGADGDTRAASMPLRLVKRVYDWKDNPDAPIASPRKDLLNPKDYLVFNPIQTSRGCPHSCSFCTTHVVFGRRYRQREIQSIVEEMRQAKEQFNSRVFIFSDDNVAGNQRWAMELFDAIRPLGVRWASQCDILIARNPKLLAAMRDSGCVGVILGLESPQADTLAEAGKRHCQAAEYEEGIRRISAHGIGIWGSFIFGFDGDDWRRCMDAVRFSQRVGLSMSIYTILTPYPGTEVFRRYEEQGRILTRDWEKYNGGSVVYQPSRMTPAQLRYAQQAAFSEFYSPASTLRRLRIWPLKRNSWLANIAIYRGMKYYYGKKGRQMPRFTDYLEREIV